MRSTFVAVAAALLVAAATPALAAGKHHARAFGKNEYARAATPSYDACEALSLQRGEPPGQGSARNPDDHHSWIVLPVRYRSEDLSCDSRQEPSAQAAGF
jgi:hypothetical protein